MLAPEMFLVRSKLSPPGIAANSLCRTALIENIERSTSRVVLVQAPAGYGKTTLLEQLYCTMREKGVSTHWLTLDAFDNSPDELVKYLLALIRAARHVGEGNEETAGRFLPRISLRTSLAQILNEAGCLGQNTVLIVDDLHVLTAPDCLTLVRMLVGDPSPGCRFILASRGRPPIDLSKLQVQGVARVLAADQIAFTLPEVAALLGDDFSDELVLRLYKQTHGWPVALRIFLALVSQCHNDPKELLPTLPELPALVTYLTEQVISRLAPGMEDLLMATSLPDRFTGELANRLCKRADAGHALKQLEEENLFIVRREDHAIWYTYNELFRDFLRKRLMQQPAAAVRTLHQRAAEWFAESGLFDAAWKHSIEARDWELAIRILEDEGGWHLTAQHGMLHGVESIPAAAMERSLLARLTLIYLLVHMGQTEQARSGFEQLRKESLEFTRWWGEPLDSLVRADCRSLEAIIIVCEERPLSIAFVEGIIAGARSAGPRGRFVRVLADSNLSFYAYYGAGRYRDCIRLAEEGVAAVKRMDAPHVLDHLYINLGTAHFALGALRVAQSWYRKALELSEMHASQEARRLEALALIAETQYYEDDLDGARHNIAEAFAGLERQSAVDSTVCQVAYLTAAALHARGRDLDRALSLLMEARTVARYLQREQRFATIEVRRVEELTRAGYYSDAEEVIRQEGFRGALTSRDDGVSVPILAMDASIALARFELLTSNATAARQRLEALWTQASGYQNELVKLRCLTLLCAAHLATGDYANSMQCLRGLCSRIIPLGLKRIIADEEPLIEPVLEYCLDRGEGPGTAARVNAEIVASTWLGSQADPCRETDSAVAKSTGHSDMAMGVLSPRQRAVLDLLAAGLSSKEIATQLALSEGTIKSYRKALYVKLRAGRRSQALANARRMSLLP